MPLFYPLLSLYSPGRTIADFAHCNLNAEAATPLLVGVLENLLSSIDPCSGGLHGIEYTVWCAGLQNSLPVKQFLQNCSAVISREPKVFFEAVLATCSIKESGGRPMVVLRRPKVS